MADRIEVKIGYPDANANHGNQGVTVALLDVVGTGNKWEKLQGDVVVNNDGPLANGGDDLLIQGPIVIRLKNFSLFQVPGVGETDVAKVTGDRADWQWRVEKVD
jgi:hypothetical protein